MGEEAHDREESELVCRVNRCHDNSNSGARLWMRTCDD